MNPPANAIGARASAASTPFQDHPDELSTQGAGQHPRDVNGLSPRASAI